MRQWPIEIEIVFYAGVLALTLYPLTLTLQQRQQAWVTFKYLLADLRGSWRGHLKNLLAFVGAYAVIVTAAGVMKWDFGLSLFLSLAAFLLGQLPSRFFFRLQYPALMTGRQGRDYRYRARTAAGCLLALGFVLAAVNHHLPFEPAERGIASVGPRPARLSCGGSGKTDAAFGQAPVKNSCPLPQDH